MSDHTSLRARVESGWEQLAAGATIDGAVAEAVQEALSLLDTGLVRIAEREPSGDWRVNEWLKKAVLLWFRLQPDEWVAGGVGGGGWWDRVPSKFAGWSGENFADAGFRAVPPCAVRHGAHIAPGAVLMPCYINIGAYIGEKSMIDTWATVGSCAQIGSGVHISGGAGIGGVLEPVQASPVIIEDDCFIGARAEVAEGVIVRQGSVLAMGVFLSQSTKIIDRDSGEVFIGEVPAYSVLVPGSMPSRSGGPSLSCAVIVKRVDARTRAKTGINELLRY